MMSEKHFQMSECSGLRFGFRDRGDRVDGQQIRSDCLAQFPAGVVQAIADHMHNTQLHSSFGKDRFDSFRKAL